LNKRSFFRMFGKSFILFFLFSFFVTLCANPDAQSDYYRALQLKKDTEKKTEAVRLFEKALGSSNEFIRHAAAEELANFEVRGTQIQARTARRVRAEASGFWAQAFEIAGNTVEKDKVIEFLLKFDQAAAQDARFFILRECEKKGIFFDEKELAAIEGHSSISVLRYNEALQFFGVFREDGNWPSQMPQIFIKNPVLINDLGRAFQYTSSGAEGLSVFLQWENNFNNTADIKNLSNAPEDVRFRLLFMAARIARRNGLRDRAISLFEQAMVLVPRSEQSDASIWYILDMSLTETRDNFIKLLEKYIPMWNNSNYYNDILERFLQTLVSAKDWKRIIGVFNVLRDSGASIRAGYAWVIARGIEEGLLSNDEKALAAGASQRGTAEVSFFVQTAYNELDNDVTSLLYYRSLSAAVLGKPVLVLPPEPETAAKNNPSPALQFILGFFSHNEVEYAFEYITRMEQELSVEELRAATYALEQAGMYTQAVRLAARYIDREGYMLNRKDLELLFPRPFNDLVEKYAAQTGIAPQMLFALIRTESAFQSDVVSHAGAIGLTQLMPDTALEMAGRIRRAGGPDYTAFENGLDMKNPEQNIHIGAYYLSYLTGRFEDELLSLLAYNGGMNRVRRWRAASLLPVDLFLETVTIYETREYGRKVMAAASVYKELYYP